MCGVLLQVELAALPRHASQAGPSGGGQAFVGVADDQLDAMQAAGNQRAEKLTPVDFGFTGRGLGVLANAPRLRHLSLWQTAVGDEGLQQLALATQLETLYLPPNMTDAGFAPLARLANLQQLHVHPRAKSQARG